MENRRLAILDVEGIIIPKRRYLILQATKNLNLFKILKILFLGFLYEIRFYTLEQALQGIYRLFEGVSQENLYQIFKEIPIIPGVQQLIQKLREKDYQMLLISSGIPDFLVEELAKKIGANYAYGVELELVNNKLTGKIGGDVIKTNGKALVLEKILKENNFSRQNCIVIADDRNNLSMFPFASRVIGYNPDSFLAAKCDYAAKGDIKEIIPYLDTHLTSNINYTKNDAVRELVHMGSFLIPLLCNFYNVNKFIIIYLLFTMTFMYALSELTRAAGVNFPILNKITNLAAIGEEKWSFATSPILFAFGIILSLIIFPSQIGFAAITILTLGDGTAKLVGKKWGKTILPYNKAKKLEGTIVGIIISASFSLLFVTPLKALVASIVSMMIESLPLPINDNLVLPLVAGLILIVV